METLRNRGEDFSPRRAVVPPKAPSPACGMETSINRGVDFSPRGPVVPPKPPVGASSSSNAWERGPVFQSLGKDMKKSQLVEAVVEAVGKSAEIWRSWQQLHENKRPLKRSFEDEELCHELQGKCNILGSGDDPKLALGKTTIRPRAPAVFSNHPASKKQKTSTQNPLTSNHFQLDAKRGKSVCRDRPMMDEVRHSPSQSQASSAQLVCGGPKLSPSSADEGTS